MGTSLRQLGRIFGFITAVRADNAYPASTRRLANDILTALASREADIDGYVAEVNDTGLSDADRNIALEFLGEVLKHGLTGGLDE